MSDTDFAELDALHRAGILTEGEYAGAREKLVARHRFTGLLGETAGPAPQATSTDLVNAPRHAAARGRHAKQPRRWPWIAGSAALLAAAVAVGIVLRPATHPSHAAGPPLSPVPNSVQSSAIVVASPANTPMAININGADAKVAVSSLVVAPASTPAARTTPTTSPTMTYTATVTVSGTTGTFAIDPDEFTAHSISGRSYPVSSIPLTTLHSTAVGAGQHAAGTIAFTVPTGEHIAVVLFTTPLGEQLGLWSTV